LSLIVAIGKAPVILPTYKFQHSLFPPEIQVISYVPSHTDSIVSVRNSAYSEVADAAQREQGFPMYKGVMA